MKLSDALTPDRIERNLSSTEKIPAIREMVALMGRSISFSDPDAVVQHVLDREAIQSTGVDRGVAIPHAQSDEIDGVAVALGISRSGIDFQGLDGQPSHLIFLILSPENQAPAYLSVLSRTARIFRNEEIEKEVLVAASGEEIVDIIRRQEPV